MRAWLIVSIAALAGAACSHGWDDLDPRIADGVGGTASASSATSTDGSGGSGVGGSGVGGSGVGGSGVGGSGVGGMAASSTGQGASGGSVGAGGAGGMGGVDFLDDFNRGNSGSIGNDWIEKTPAAFNLAANHALKAASGGSYRQNLVYRPMSEAILNVEASVELEFTTSTIHRPQLFVRGRWANIDDADGYVGYKVWINGSPTSAVLSLQNGSGGSNELQPITLAPALAQGERYRMRLRAEGTNPVTLEAWVEHQSGNMWVEIGHAVHSDSASTRIDVAGVVGFAGSSSTGYFMDNFRYNGL